MSQRQLSCSCYNSPATLAGAPSLQREGRPVRGENFLWKFWGELENELINFNQMSTTRELAAIMFTDLSAEVPVGTKDYILSILVLFKVDGND